MPAIRLIFNGEEGLPAAEMSPWLDLRVPPKEVKLPEVEDQTHRRFLKTQLPVDALVFSPRAKFADLKADMPGEIRRIADLLDIPVDEARWQDILTHCSFDYMKANATPSVPLGGAFWDGGARTFINKGTEARWRDTLDEEERGAYEARALAELGADCAKWLAAGGWVGLAPGDMALRCITVTDHAPKPTVTAAAVAHSHRSVSPAAAADQSNRCHLPRTPIEPASPLAPRNPAFPPLAPLGRQKTRQPNPRSVTRPRNLYIMRHRSRRISHIAKSFCVKNFLIAWLFQDRGNRPLLRLSQVEAPGADRLRRIGSEPASSPWWTMEVVR